MGGMVVHALNEKARRVRQASRRHRGQVQHCLRCRVLDARVGVADAVKQTCRRRKPTIRARRDVSRDLLCYALMGSA